MSQRSLFDAEPPAWEIDAQSMVLAATVVLPSGPPGEFDYAIPDTMADPRKPDVYVEPGRRVRAPLGRGNRPVVGYCVAVGPKPSSPSRPLKPLRGVLDPVSLVSPSMLRLTRWMADHYLTPWGQVLEGVVPSGVRGRAGTRDVTLLSVPTKVAARLTGLELPPKQADVLQALAASSKPLSLKQLAMRVGCTTAPINALRKRGLIESRVERLATDGLLAEDVAVERQPAKRLNPDQARTLDTILAAVDAGEHETILVHGVTGSGKTEVYLQAIERVVSFGRQAIVLVPEISLTPQTVGRFRERFDRIAVLHSHQSDVERHRQWRRIAAGDVEVVVGARSAVFAPTPHLGLVVIDEEHETTFKQDTAPRYHARDVALERTRAEGVPLVLASATPSLEAWRCSQPGAPERFRLASMPRRIGDLPMPAVRVVDLRVDGESRGAISRPLYQAMDQALRDDGQIILLLNRRGYSTHVQCPACGYALKCDHCDVAMTFHRQDNAVVCHWCDYRSAPPTVCPDCRSPRIRYGGMGTQKLEAEVNARFRGVSVTRMDADTMRRPGSHETALDAFRHGETRILLGTQMIAKGLDFPNVTLVGVISADSALNLPDFRAAERTFQLVTQVAGRTGRGERGGRVIVQTFDPDHPAILAAVRHDYERFASEELPARRALGYPPFGVMARIIARGASEPLLTAYLDQVAETLKRAVQEAGAKVRLVGPAPAPITRLRGEFRRHLQMHSPSGDAVRAALRAGWLPIKPPEGVRSVVDIDPTDML
ncbi:Primosomal protein N' [Botrimarina colliarenosi]|uniref:Replication restart protein PriA n=1 Tax=Botrimarina colliarenosi TaxID=2528001 RepID=A0A5C6AIH1_9BACT|nr:primosomal protein N' [Botrimarina colliarenosi]TWT99804.1 Primosomal protein N' [Botrimarina colliarenosi]